MTPFHKLAHAINWAKGHTSEPPPRPLSDAEVMRARFALWLRRCQASDMKVPDIIARIHAEPPESDWFPGEPETNRDGRRPC